eukprot:364500-Chlamydomonas_euryale.AAC.5
MCGGRQRAATQQMAWQARRHWVPSCRRCCGWRRRAQRAHRRIPAKATAVAAAPAGAGARSSRHAGAPCRPALPVIFVAARVAVPVATVLVSLGDRARQAAVCRAAVRRAARVRAHGAVPAARGEPRRDGRPASRGAFPQAQRALACRRQQARAVGAEREARHDVAMALRDRQHRAVHERREHDEAVAPAARDELAGHAEREALDWARVLPMAPRDVGTKAERPPLQRAVRVAQHCGAAARQHLAAADALAVLAQRVAQALVVECEGARAIGREPACHHRRGVRLEPQQRQHGRRGARWVRHAQPAGHAQLRIHGEARGRHAQRREARDGAGQPAGRAHVAVAVAAVEQRVVVPNEHAAACVGGDSQVRLARG